MDSSEVSLVRPVSGLRKTAKVSKTGPREQRRRKSNRDPIRQDAHEEGMLTEPDAEESPAVNSTDDPHAIDFRA